MIIDVSSIPWDAITTGAAALAAVALTGRITRRSTRRDQRRADYAGLVQAARDLLDAHRQAFAPKAAPMDTAAAEEFNREIGMRVSALYRAAAMVEIGGSAAARAAARALYKAAAEGMVSGRLTNESGTWTMTVTGPGDVAFEHQIDAFIDTARAEIVPSPLARLLPRRLRARAQRQIGAADAKSLS